MRIFSQACRHYIWCAYGLQATTSSVPARIGGNPMSANRHLLKGLRALTFQCVECGPQSLDQRAMRSRNPAVS